MKPAILFYAIGKCLGRLGSLTLYGKWSRRKTEFKPVKPRLANDIVQILLMVE